jgi:hypothetical protein
MVKRGVLYLCMNNRIYTLTNNLDYREVESIWTTPEDEFNYPQYQKTTNKRGCVIDMEANDIEVWVKTDNAPFEYVNRYKATDIDIKKYVVARIKRKKWKSIQLRFISSYPFKLYSNTLEAYVGGYVKR